MHNLNAIFSHLDPECILNLSRWDVLVEWQRSACKKDILILKYCTGKKERWEDHEHFAFIS